MEIPNSSGAISELWADFAQMRTAPGSEGWRFAMDHPTVRSYVYDTYLGGQDPFGLALTLLPEGPLTALEIGCGGGDLAIGLAKTGRFSRIDAFDISAGAVDLARIKAEREGVHNVFFQAADINSDPLPSGPYDFVYSSHALHHIENLEALFSHIKRTLKPSGLFFNEDYVGPSRMQFSDYHVNSINRVFQTLPESKRRDAWFEDTIKSEVIRVPLEKYLEIDPSEGVRASEIVAVAEEHLSIKVFPMGMSLAYETLSGIVRNFNPYNAADEIFVTEIIKADKLATYDPDIPMCFALLIGRLRPNDQAAHSL